MVLLISAAAAAGGASSLTASTFLTNLLIAVGCQSSVYLFKRLTKPFLKKALLHLVREDIRGDLLEHWACQGNVSYGDLLLQALEAMSASFQSWILKRWGESFLSRLSQSSLDLWETLMDFFNDLMRP